MSAPLGDRLAALRERAAAAPPEAWRPEPGDALAGVLVRYETGHTDFGGEKHIAVIRDEGGVERAFWLLHAVALDEFKKLRPAPGELIAVRYLGRRTSVAGQPYQAYRVVVDREPPDLDEARPADDEEAAPV